MDFQVPRTPSPPNPGTLLNSADERSKSRCSVDFLAVSDFVPHGSANIHFCMTVQMLGTGFEGAIVFILSRAPGDAGRDCANGIVASSLITAVLPSDTTGRRACHWASLCATPRHTDSFARSFEVHTWPRMNLYRRPFWKRASSGGARPCCARRECDVNSPERGQPCRA